MKKIKDWEIFIREFDKSQIDFSQRNNSFYMMNPILKELNNYICSSCERIFSLYEDTIFLLKNNRILSASITARSLFEGICVLMEFLRKIRASIQKGIYKNFKNTLVKFTFASREFESGEFGSLPNVMDAIRSSEKLIKNTSMIYGILCEAVHPNWTGRVVLKINQIENDPVTLRLYLSILSLSTFLKECMHQILDFDNFINQNKRSIKRMLLDLN